MARTLILSQDTAPVNPDHLISSLRVTYHHYVFRANNPDGVSFQWFESVASELGISLSQLYRRNADLEAAGVIVIHHRPKMRPVIQPLFYAPDIQLKCESTATPSRARDKETLTKKESKKKKQTARATNTPECGASEGVVSSATPFLSPQRIEEWNERVEAMLQDTVSHPEAESPASAVMPQSVEIEFVGPGGPNVQSHSGETAQSFEIEKSGPGGPEDRGSTRGNEGFTPSMQTRDQSGTLAQTTEAQAGGFPKREGRIEVDGDRANIIRAGARGNASEGHEEDAGSVLRSVNGETGQHGDTEGIRFDRDAEKPARGVNVAGTLNPKSTAGDATIPADSANPGVASLLAYGVRLDKASELAAKYPSWRIQQAVAYLRQRLAQGHSIPNPAGFLIKSLEENYTMKLLDATPEAIAAAAQKRRQSAYVPVSALKPAATLERPDTDRQGREALFAALKGKNQECTYQST
jgi:hypothetical protein